MVSVLCCWSADARQPQRGYRGFLEWSSSLRNQTFATWETTTSTGSYSENTFYTGLTTSHGYQINPMFFIGAGLGLEKCSKIDSWIVPVFVQGRADFKFGKFTPFGDLRVGYNVTQGGGMYFSPTIGYRFNFGGKFGINIGAGLSLAGYTAEHYDGSFTDLGGYEIQYIGKEKHMNAYFSFRVGIDF